MTKEDIQLMLYEYMKSSEKNLSAFMDDVSKRNEKLAECMRNIAEQQRKVLERLDEQDTHSKEFRENMLPVRAAFDKSVTIRDFIQNSGKLIINLGLIVGGITAIKIFFFK